MTQKKIDWFIIKNADTRNYSKKEKLWYLWNTIKYNINIIKKIMIKNLYIKGYLLNKIIVKTILNIIKFMIQEDVIFIKHKWLSIVKKNNSKLIYIKS